MVRVLVLLLLLTGCTSSGYASIDGVTVDAADPRRLMVDGIHGTCDELQEVVVEQDDDEVRLTVPVRTPRTSCNDAGAVYEREVRLAAPLGTRRVVHARNGRVLRVVGRDRCRPSPGSDEALLGLPVEAARARHGGRPFRITCVDGQELDRTADFRPDRLNVAVDDGVVTATSLG